VVFWMHIYDVIVQALVFYDHLRTLSCEVQYIWCRQAGAVTLIFYLNRYAIFIWSVLSICGLFVLVNNLRVSKAFTHDCPYLALQVKTHSIAAFSAIRTYAITQCNWWLSVTVFALSMVPAGVNAVGAHNYESLFMVINMILVAVFLGT
ncbi:hypothetical protein OBBRIDRAFT_730687, partial [Obba rivulosa]